MYKNSIRMILMPVIVILAIMAGMFINSLLIRRNIQNRRELFLPVQGSKVDLVLNMVNHSYVDTVDIREIEEGAVEAVIKDLDPHTVYIPAKDLEKVNEGMTGNFGGVGVQFYKYRDTVTVVKVVPGGPSEAAGIRDGDRILRVDDTLIAGVKMDDKRIMAMMRGELNTEVVLTVLRHGQAPVAKKVVRGNIPIKSVEVAYMVNDTAGYVKVKTFGMNTYDEFIRALESLQKQGMKKLIVDLRNNEGGILPIALKMVNEFLDADKLILYTQGKASPRSDYYSNGRGRFKDLPLVVLINEVSASASEIFAGAIQDNDRGVIVGRRSFGKGLVQEQRMLPDGSALRLTVARYYIPSGRSIQRPYDEGKEKYYNDFYERVVRGELEVKDSIRFDENLKFQTVGGRTVYGGGGIMPDVFVPVDTAGYSRYLGELNRSMKLYEFTFDFMDRHREEMKGIKDYKALLDYLDRFNLVEEMVQYASRHGIKKNPKDLNTSYNIILNNIQAYIGRHVLDDDGFYPILGMTDETMREALRH